jgi:hypothetical protein
MPIGGPAKTGRAATGMRIAIAAARKVDERRGERINTRFVFMGIYPLVEGEAVLEVELPASRQDLGRSRLDSTREA